MKTKTLLIIIAIIAGSLAAQAQDKMYEKFSGNKDISTVFISKALLSMASGMDMGGMNIKGLTSKLERMEIYTSESKNAMKLMASEMEAVKKNKVYETLMTVKEEDDITNFYALKSSDGKFKEMIMHISDADECTIIRIVGNFTMEDIQSVTQDMDL